MPPDPYEMMLRKAEQDAALALKFVDDASVSDEHVGFFCQQAVEKAVKSVLSYRNVPYRRTHDLSELFELALTRGIDHPDDLSECVRLTPFAVVFRYDELPPGRPATIFSIEPLGAYGNARGGVGEVLGRGA